MSLRAFIRICVRLRLHAFACVCEYYLRSNELARLYSAFANGSAMESIALMATTVLQILALQLPHKVKSEGAHQVSGKEPQGLVGWESYHTREGRQDCTTKTSQNIKS